MLSATTSARTWNYSEVLNSTPMRSGYAIRNARYKLIQFDSGNQELYDLEVDPYEQDDLLSGTLTLEQATALQELTSQAALIRQ